MLKVNLDDKSYDIIINKNSLNNVGKWVKSLWSIQQIALITDSNVEGLYAKKVIESLENEGFEITKIVVEAGENSKSFTKAQYIYDILSDHNFTRSDGIIALGGGVIGDLAGFIASTYMRGIHFLQIPTTLLAQVDSSIGGKTAINTSNAKNLIGAFWQPQGVLIDPNTLNTLDIEHIKEGLAEIIKSAAIADIKLWNKLALFNDINELLTNIEEIILSCLKIKAKIVELDELDNNIRLILNFGHTIGHAIESTLGYNNISHGKAVALGMVQVNKISENKGLSSKGSTNEIIKMLKKYDINTNFDISNKESLYQALIHDKKSRGNIIKLIILEKIGQAKIIDVDLEEIKDYLE